MKILLLLLGWAMIGQGMWYTKKGIPKSRLENLTLTDAFSKRLAKSGDEIIFALAQFETQKILKQLEKEAEIKRMRKLQPQASIKIKLNTIDSTIPDCHFPHRIVYKYTHPVDQILKLVFCNTRKRVYSLARHRENIAITFTVCADEQMCKENYLQQGLVKKIDNQLAIVPPLFEDKFVSCCIEYPIGGEFDLETRDFDDFMQDIQDPVIPDSDSSDLDLSDGQDSEQD